MRILGLKLYWSESMDRNLHLQNPLIRIIIDSISVKRMELSILKSKQSTKREIKIPSMERKKWMGKLRKLKAMSSNIKMKMANGQKLAQMSFMLIVTDIFLKFQLELQFVQPIIMRSNLFNSMMATMHYRFRVKTQKSRRTIIILI